MGDADRRAVKAAVEAVRDRIRLIRERGDHIGEGDTKAALIEPILGALGWALQDLDEVSREYRHKPQDNPVDYALFIMRSPCLFVEAKSVSKDMGDYKWISQTLSYATVAGVKWCVLTNGDEYRLYNSHAPVAVEEKLLRSVTISSQDEENRLLDTLLLLSKDKMREKELDVLWRAHFVDRKVKEALRDVLDNQEQGLIRLIRRKTKELKPSEIRDSLKRADLRITFPGVPVPPGPVSRPTPEPKPPRPSGSRATLADLISAGVIEPPLALENTYKGVKVEALVDERGKVVYDGAPYSSPSTAAGMARKSVIGAPPGREYPQTNGWTFWRCADAETGEIAELDVLRQRYLERSEKA